MSADFDEDLARIRADEGGHPTTWEPLDLTHAVTNTEPDQPTLLHRSDGACLLYPGRLHAFNGENESLKTWLALLAVKQTLDGGGNAMFIDFEDSERGIVGRLRAMGVPAAVILSDQFTYLHPEWPMWVAAEEVCAMVDDLQPKLVVIDGVTEAMAVHRLNPMDNVEIAQFYAAVPKKFSKAGAAAVDLDHVTKDAKTRGRFPLGGQAKLAGIDGAAYNIDALNVFAKGRTGKSRLTVAKDRPGGVREHAAGGKIAGELTLTSWPDGGVTAHLDAVAEVDPTKPFRPTTLMERISKVIELHPEGMSQRMIRGSVKGASEAKLIALEMLHLEGYVIIDKGERGALVHRIVKPFRVIEDTAQ